MRVFLDANVLFSTSNGGSNIARLIALLTERETGITSDVAVEEARRNLALKRNMWRRRLRPCSRSWNRPELLRLLGRKS